MISVYNILNNKKIDLHHNIEKFNTNNDNMKQLIFKQDIVKSFDLDNYSIFDNNIEIYKTSGKWNLDESNWQLIDIINNKTINIIKDKNQYKFNNVIIDMQNKIIIINNYENELFLTDNLIKTTDNNIIASLNNNILEYKNNENLSTYIICFIIIKQLHKQLNFSHDK